MVIEDFYGTFIGYPFQLKAKLEINIAELNKMMGIGWRTARLCANETYMNCPYWEQLQVYLEWLNYDLHGGENVVKL